MKIVFLSNFYNHHQSLISEKLYELTDGNYRFIETAPMPEDRKKLGYQEKKAPFLISYHQEEEVREALAWIEEADVVIVGSAPEFLLKKRKSAKKVIFRYSEHPLKQGNQLWKYPLRWMKWHYHNLPGSPIYMLCASAYTASEYKKFGLFKNRTYRWGYFPECKIYENAEKLIAEKNKTEILWCGRFLDWKHPDDVLNLAQRLKADGAKFHINIIGTGEMEEELKDIYLKNDLSDVVSFCGSMSPSDVRAHMEKSGIYLMTSDHKEGWGAVVNEAMNSGCAVVATLQAGSVPFLIQNNVNGLTYHAGNVEELYHHVKYLLEEQSEQNRLGWEAYRTISELWNADLAATRLFSLCEYILNGENRTDLFAEGPCSKS